MRCRLPAGIAALLIATALTASLMAAAPTTLNDFFLPGSQPNQSGNIQTPDKCDNCHGGYDIAVEPAFNWRGSMMAQAARDPLFFACLAIANQDAPESGDLCIRCHSPSGWLEGRSTPTDGSALNNNDREGVQCDFCHKAVKPTQLGVNPYPDDPDYTSGTYAADQAYLGTLTDIPAHSADGMYVADSDNAKRGPFVDAQATHQMFYSPFHSEAAFCGTCHDVSNPAFSREPSGNYIPNDFDQPAPDFDPYALFPIERTYSEWLKSDYNTAQGIYAPQFGGNKDYVSTCQDCHLKDVTGFGCNKAGAPERTDLPLHDMTGGNTFIPGLIESLFPGETYPAALDSGIVRARRMLQMAASLEVTVTEGASGFDALVRVTNETGHKLPSGYPEGRRLWLNIRAYDSTATLIYESAAYDSASGVLTHDDAAKIYEIKPGLSDQLAPVLGLPAGPSFHFAVNDTIFLDNRIPPRGFTNAAFDSIQSPPIGYSYADGQYWDDTEYQLPPLTAMVVVNLYYQTTSKDYVEFLRDENVTNDWGDVFYDLWANNGKSPPELMNTDTVYVQPVVENQPPVLDSIGSQAIDEGVQLNFTVTATDPDGTIPDLTTSQLPDGALFTDNNNGSGDFVWTPTYEQAGDYAVTFYATDAQGAADSESVTITVSDVNRPPELDSIGPQAVEEGNLLAFVVTASDPDGTIPDLTTSQLPDGALFTDNNNGSGNFVWTPSSGQAGDYPVTFYATDALGAADSEAVIITVYEVNLSPELDSIGPQTVEENSLLAFVVTASDPDGTIPDLSTSLLPDGALFTDNEDGSGDFAWTPTYEQAGDYAVTFYATDALGAADSENVQITVVNVNRGPILDPIGDKDGTVGQLLAFQVTASDPDNDSVWLSGSNLPPGALFSYQGWDAGLQKYKGEFSWTPDASQVGFYANVLFSAVDGIAVTEEAISITITGEAFVCGDADGSGIVNVSDAVYLIAYIFGGGPPPSPLESGDVDCNGNVNISDAVYMIAFIFGGGPEPCADCP